ncbi:uncharacterized protein K452DRAFT_285466 [Aplosporella prunicola CBS 121167]|uniref:CAF1-domain-containing protein n=1 Tax=Aplosporella prunicola CBS 121167 TaxID=1176127 RepID=A0A6A6BN14_9PEZI|nr:uncharacterized protein K452DRAFT_285466 [Aplosporella prunicola CBS 121167]KAF2144217.1 hypothetical protein K452DRAFT_285466 [Aplosporella prunicola CBS 121167]
MTIEQRYQEVKAAAERYQILQIGLTCAEQDTIDDKYTLRPYNFNLNPLLEERLDIERIFAFQSGAAEFLLSHGFRMDLPMTMGVPYLSRDEAKLAKKLAYARWDKSTMQDVQLELHEVESLEFVRKVRIAIENWKKTGKPSPSYLNIVCSDPIGPQPLFPELGNFEKRLVHQLVRAEYPDLVSLSKPSAIQLKAYDEEREKSYLESKKRGLRKSIERQTGFRWIVEALCGGSLTMDPKSFARDVLTGEPKTVDIDDLNARIGRARANLKMRRPVLVGHNLFTDIIYFYRTFIGELPPTLDEFQKKVHELFPLIVDTKYMATHNCGDINPASALEQIEEKLRSQPKPVLETHGAHRKYHTHEAFHEAGYDSFLTANIMVRLSAKLSAAGTYLSEVKPKTGRDTDDEAYETASDGDGGGGGGVALSAAQAIPPGNAAASTGLLTASTEAKTRLLTPAIAPPVLASQTSAPAAPASTTSTKESRRKEKKLRKKKEKKAAKATATAAAATKDTAKTESSRFSTQNLYDQLAALSANDDGESHSEEDGDVGADAAAAAAAPHHHPPNAGGWDTAPVLVDGTTYYVPKVEVEAKEPMALMPPFESPFWGVYGNKLRVFGTVESVCALVG